MPYRILRRNEPTSGWPSPVWCLANDGERCASNDEHSFRYRADAERSRDTLARIFPRCDYVVVGSPNAYRWDALLQQYASPGTAPVVDDDDEDDENICEHCDFDCGNQGEAFCDECGEHGHSEDSHEWYECQNCGYQCGAPDCTECVSCGPDGDWCQCCADDYYDEEGGSEGSPGLRLTECPTCHSYDVHHDDIAERFVCDCQARRLLADRRPVTLARPLTNLTEVA